MFQPRSYKDVWIGLRDVNKNGQFSLVDGSDEVFTAWQQGEPNYKGQENCAVYQHINQSKHGWNNIGCHAVKQYICKYKPDILANAGGMLVLFLIFLMNSYFHVYSRQVIYSRNS